MERIEQLQTLSDAATEYVISKFGTTTMKCVEGRHNLFTSARKAGLKVEKAQGFFFGQHHNWVYDPITEAIIDPTANQFGARNGVIKPSDRQYELYDTVPKEHLHHLGHQPSLQHMRWQAAKKWVMAGTLVDEEYGEEKVEWRTSKKGDDYLYFSKVVHFNAYPTEHIRSGLVFTTDDGGYHLSLVMQRRVMVNGKVYRPTRIKHLYVSLHGALLMSVKGKWQPYREEQGYYRTPEQFVSVNNLPEEVKDLLVIGGRFEFSAYDMAGAA